VKTSSTTDDSKNEFIHNVLAAAKVVQAFLYYNIDLVRRTSTTTLKWQDDFFELAWHHLIFITFYICDLASGQPQRALHLHLLHPPVDLASSTTSTRRPAHWQDRAIVRLLALRSKLLASPQERQLPTSTSSTSPSAANFLYYNNGFIRRRRRSSPWRIPT
jgi:hypothetical protein